MATYNFTVTQMAVPFVAKFQGMLPLVMNMNKQFDKSFGKGNGDTITVTIPSYPTVQNGPTAVPDNYTSGDRLITLTQNNVSIDANAVVRALDIGNWDAQVAEPYSNRLASFVEERVATYGTLNADASIVLDPTNGFKGLGAGASSIKKARSYGRLCGVLDPELNQAIADTGIQFFNPSNQISDMFRESKIGRYAGVEFYESPNVPTLVTGDLALGTATLDATLAEGATSMTINDAGLAGGEVVKAGTVFNMAGVKCVDIYGNATSQDYAFTAQADATAVAGAVTITIKPISYAKPTTNVSVASVVAGTSVTQLHDADSTYVQGLIYDDTSFIFGSAKFAPLASMKQKEMKIGKSISLTTSQGSDPIEFKDVVRWDILSSQLLARTNWAATVSLKVA